MNNWEYTSGPLSQGIGPSLRNIRPRQSQKELSIWKDVILRSKLDFSLYDMTMTTQDLIQCFLTTAYLRKTRMLGKM